LKEGGIAYFKNRQRKIVTAVPVSYTETYLVIEAGKFIDGIEQIEIT